MPLYNSIVFSKRGKNVLSWIGEKSLSDDLLILSGNNPMPVDSIVFCNAELVGKRVNFKSVSNRIILLENGDSTTVSRLFKKNILSDFVINMARTV